jgi:hypothetical protein
MAKNIKRESKFPGLMDDLKPTPTHTHDDTHTYTHNDEPIVKRERRTRRVQLLMKESLVDVLDAYAAKHDVSRTEIIQSLVEKFLQEKRMI